MPQVIRGLHLDRRRFLEGAGASLALPFLDAMLPARGVSGSRPLRAVFVFAPNGVKTDDWFPRGEGRSFALPNSLEPLKERRKDVTVLSGLTLDGARPHGDGPGDHARAAASFLTASHPRKTGGADIRAGVSVDQVLARRIGGDTPFRSLELGVDRGRRAGSCDSGYSCAYTNNISWKAPGTPVPKATRPKDVFRRLFGDPDAALDAAARRAAATRRRSLLDLVLEDANDLRRRLGGKDRAKLAEYLDAVRDLEKKLETDQGDVDLPEGAEQVLQGGGGRRNTIRRMYDILALALQTDRVRVATFMLGNAGSNVTFPHLNISEGHHDLSHHGKDDNKLAQLRRIDRFHVEEYTRFLDRLAAIDDGQGSLLDRSVVLFGSGISDGDRHNHDELPVLLAGRAGGLLHPGRHVRFPRNTPLANLYLTLLRGFDCGVETFGDATGPLRGIWGPSRSATRRRSPRRETGAAHAPKPSRDRGFPPLFIMRSRKLLSSNLSQREKLLALATFRIYHIGIN